jgi:hypothetical protein
VSGDLFLVKSCETWSHNGLARVPCFSGSHDGLITGFTCGTFNLELGELDVMDCVHNTFHHIEMQTAMNTPTSSPTVSPIYENIPLPPSDTCTVASTRVASPKYMPHTPSPVEYWMPEAKDIQGNLGTTVEHASFVVA